MVTTQGVKLDEATRLRLKLLAKQKDRTPHWLMRTAIARYLDQEERYEQEKREDADRWQNYQLTGHGIPHDEATKWLGELADGKPAPCLK